MGKNPKALPAKDVKTSTKPPFKPTKGELQGKKMPLKPKSPRGVVGL